MRPPTKSEDPPLFVRVSQHHHGSAAISLRAPGAPSLRPLAPPPIRAADLEVAENTEKRIAIASSGADAKNGCDVCAIKCWTKEGCIGSYDWRFLCTPQVPGHRLEAGSWQRSAAVRFR